VKLSKKHLQETVYDVLLATYESPDAVRSSKRTDILHEGFANYAIDFPSMSSFVQSFEQKVNSADGSFKIDLLCDDGTTEILFLLKQVGSSYNKNRKNYANTTMGEVFRSLPGFPNRKVAHINFIPESAPCFDKSGDIKRVERTNRQDLSHFYKAVRGLYSDRAAECILKFRIDEDLLFSKTRKELYDGLCRHGLGSVQLLNYEEFTNSLENFLG